MSEMRVKVTIEPKVKCYECEFARGYIPMYCPGARKSTWGTALCVKKNRRVKAIYGNVGCDEGLKGKGF